MHSVEGGGGSPAAYVTRCRIIGYYGPKAAECSLSAQIPPGRSEQRAEEAKPPHSQVDMVPHARMPTEAQAADLLV